ncbi:MAG: hypothetical protein ACE5DX_05425 [Candidatus Dojkabacteria bacterium]
MATNSNAYPTSLNDFLRPSATDTMNTSGVELDVILDALMDAQEAVESKVGISSSTDQNSHDFKLSGVAGGDKAASLTGSETLTNKTLTSPTLTDPTLTDPVINALSIDTISESTTNNGVVIDSVTNKDGDVILGNANAFKIKDVGGTEQNIATVDASDNMVVGDADYNSYSVFPQEGARVTKSSTQNINDSSATLITWDTETFDPNSAFDLANDKYTTKVAGLYLIHLTLRFEDIAGAGTGRSLIYVNGSSVAANNQPAAASNQNIPVTTLQSIGAGVDIEFYAFQNSGSTKILNDNNDNVFAFVAKLF